MPVFQSHGLIPFVSDQVRPSSNLGIDRGWGTAAGSHARGPEVDDRIAEDLVDARRVAQVLAVRPQWVREHAGELGGVRLGDGPKAPWRFEVREVLARILASQLPPPEQVEGRSKTGASFVSRVVDRQRNRVALLDEED